MTETTMEEIERLNPQFKWSRRKTKRYIKKLYKRLRLNSYAMGCRGHPGILVKKSYHEQHMHGADCEIRSLIDDVVESCSIFHCGPTPLAVAYALWLAVPFNHKASGVASTLQWVNRNRFHPEPDSDNWGLDEYIEVKIKEWLDELPALIVTPDDQRVYDRLVDVWRGEVDKTGEEFPTIDLGYRGHTFL